ncbi:MAG TPA: bifunctional protein-serine/threonine kinase/phosphatase [Burkholderiales bacterium]|nr:bifunctional protein-serine/threonine kinase/phosphatase [Burkholderiales bacterium]
MTSLSDAPPDFFRAEARLKVAVGQHSDRGRKAVNQDFYGFRAPTEPQLSAKGIAIALADGIGSSDVSQVAAEFAVMAFLDDYYSTSETWSVRKSADRVLAAANSWLHSRTCNGSYRYEKDRGYVCTLSGLVLKGTTAHLFHVGDTRVYRLQGLLLGNGLEQLTQDHRVRVTEHESCLSRAVGFNAQLEIDYHALEIERGDVFVLATDGVYEHVDAAFVARAIREARGDLDGAARAIIAEAYRRGSADNLTVQIVCVEDLPEEGNNGLREQLARLTPPPLLEARAEIDGYRIVREIHASARSHLYLAEDLETGARVVLKTPACDLQADPELLERFMLEEWIARRLNSPHVLKPYPRTRERRFLYVAMEYVEGRSLAQWMTDNPRPDLETVRGIVEQIARGLQAFHRMEMLHQDLRPANIMIDRTGTVKIIDFGSVRVAGVDEQAPAGEPSRILGTLQYTAPEYFVGDAGGERADLYSLGVIAYQMLSGRLPYEAQAARVRTRAAQRKLRYATVLDEQRDIPPWIDVALRKAVHPEPLERYEALSEFVYDLRHPNAELLRRAPLISRNPVAFWRTACAVLGTIVFLLLLLQFGLPKG